MAGEVEDNNRLASKNITDDEELVHDSSVNHRGDLPLRASSGVWKAFLFIIGKG